MTIDTDKIKDLLASNLTGYRVAQLTNVKQPMYDRYKNGETPIENMTLKVASQLMRVIEIEEKNIDENVMHNQDESSKRIEQTYEPILKKYKKENKNGKH